MRIRRYLAEGTLSPRPQIDEAKDWAAGRAALSSTAYDCVLLDYRLPDLDGLSILAELRGTQALLPPIIMETVHDDEETGIRAIEAGAQDYLVKGKFDSPTLRRAIRYACERHRLLREQARIAAELRAALDQVRTLEGILPICMMCKKIRDDSGYWGAVEEYVSRHSNARFSHSFCPECLKEYVAREGLDPADLDSER